MPAAETALSSKLSEVEGKLAQALETVMALEKENTLLRRKIDLLVRRIFGSKSEGLDPAQLLFLLQGIDEPGKAPEPVAVEATRRSPGQSPPRERGPRLPEHMPVIEEVILPPEVKAAPQEWRRIGEEVSERLDYEPARFLCLRTVRPKYVQRGVLDTVPIVAPLPDSLLERSLVTPGLLTQIIVSKYCDHLPFTDRKPSTGAAIKSGCRGKRWPSGSAWPWLKPIYQEINKGVFGEGYVQVDETPIRYLAPGNGKTKLDYLWTCADPRGDVTFHWEPSHAAACLDNIIPADFRGILQCDGYEAYDCFARRRAGHIALAGCMAHVRRKFFDAKEQAPRVAGWILKHIGHLYLLEKAWVKPSTTH